MSAMPEQFDFDALERPLVVLIGGGSGVGKSTVATQLAHGLGIPRVSSTDFIRAVLRSVVPDAIAPELSRSSFELDQGLSHNDAAPHAEFERQAQQVLVGVRAMIERAVLENTPFILEGVHLLPGLRHVQRWLLPLFERHGVKLVFTAHEHNYVRSRRLLGGREDRRGVTYVIAGGGGAALEPLPPTPSPLTAVRGRFFHHILVTVAGRALRVRAVDTSGRVRDRFRLSCPG